VLTTWLLRPAADAGGQRRWPVSQLLMSVPWLLLLAGPFFLRRIRRVLDREASAMPGDKAPRPRKGTDMGNLADMTHLHPAAPDSALQRLLIPSTPVRSPAGAAPRRAARRHRPAAGYLPASWLNRFATGRFYASTAKTRYASTFGARRHIPGRGSRNTAPGRASMPPLFREADPVGGIIDLAEEPMHHHRRAGNALPRPVPDRPRTKLLNRQGSIPVTWLERMAAP
jgi:hypothetical protein